MRNFIFILVFTAAIPVFAQNNIMLNLNAGSMSFGGNLPINNDYNYENQISILNAGIENNRTNIGFNFSSLHIYNWRNDGIENGFDLFSFLNFMLYWNVLRTYPEENEDDNLNFYLGPFASVNYMFYDQETFYWDRFIISAGLRVGLRYSRNRINYDFLSFEMGYRNIFGSNRYYLSAKIDLILMSTIFFYFIGLDAQSKIDDRNKW